MKILNPILSSVSLVSLLVDAPSPAALAVGDDCLIWLSADARTTPNTSTTREFKVDASVNVTCALDANKGYGLEFWLTDLSAATSAFLENGDVGADLSTTGHRNLSFSVGVPNSIVLSSGESYQLFIKSKTSNKTLIASSRFPMPAAPAQRSSSPSLSSSFSSPSTSELTAVTPISPTTSTTTTEQLTTIIPIPRITVTSTVTTTPPPSTLTTTQSQTQSGTTLSITGITTLTSPTSILTSIVTETQVPSSSSSLDLTSTDTNPAPTTSLPAGHSSNGLSSGAITGLAVGSCAGALLLLAGGWLLLRCLQQRRADQSFRASIQHLGPVEGDGVDLDEMRPEVREVLVSTRYVAPGRPPRPVDV